VYRVICKDSIEEKIYSVQLQKITQSKLVLNDREASENQDTRRSIESVSLATSIFGEAFDVASHDANVANMAVYFERDRLKAKERFENKKKLAEERKKKQSQAKKKVPKLARKIRKFLIKKELVPTQVIISKFEPLCRKHGFTQTMFRDALRSAGKLENGIWRAKGVRN